MTQDPAAAPVLSITPVDGLIDAPRRIVVAGLASDALVAISARTLRQHGVLWDSQATYMADAQVGIVQSPQFFDYNDEVHAHSPLEYGAGNVQEYFYRIIQPARGNDEDST